ncbi:MAG TPA: DMT family transporter [Tepidisphaeraceae bacterium]|nr:DMT family transporter [Tepidisphaeraceae bacterium]
MRYLVLLLVIVSGAGIPIQVSANKRIEQAVHSPALAATVALFVGALALAAVSATGWLGRGDLAGLTKTPWWAWAASGLSLFTVISIIALPRVGAGAVIAATVFGELTAAALLDHFGWLGVPQIRMSWWRICGAVVLFVGVLMMQQK